MDLFSKNKKDELKNAAPVMTESEGVNEEVLNEQAPEKKKGKLASKEISFKGEKGAPPKKRYINLVAEKDEKGNIKIFIPALIIIIIAAFCLGKFGVADRYNALAEEKSKVSQMQSEIDAGYARISELQNTTGDYAHYTYSGMTEEELQLVNRSEVIKLLTDSVINKAQISSWSLSNNLLTISAYGATLGDINDVVSKLKESEIVNYCTVTTAATNNETSTSDATDVTAQITVYLQNPSDEDEGGAN